MNTKNFKENKMYKSVIKYVIALIIILYSIYLLKFSKEISIAIINSINSCLTVIIPSLFAFMVVSNILIKSNIYVILSKPFYPVAKYLFRIPPELFSIFLLSCIGGYPIGAKLLTDLLSQNKISKDTANTMMCYCYCNSPSFFAGAVGVVVFENVLVGLLIYFSIVLSNCIIAIILGFKNKIPEKKKIRANISINVNILIESINSAAKTLFLICIMLIFFASLISVIEETGILNFICSKISLFYNFDTTIFSTSFMSFVEISKISQFPKFCYAYIPILAILGSFGGLCVLSQIVAITSRSISLKKFLITRPLHLAFSSIICYYLIKVFTKDIVIMTILSPTIFKKNTSTVIPTLCLILMTILLLNKKKDFYRKV